MIIVKKSEYLKYKNLKFRCSLGKAGIKKKKVEGDNITPKGIFKITSVYYRPDRIKKITTQLKKKNLKLQKRPTVGEDVTDGEEEEERRGEEQR
jgi:L,D-peptidoglycan transpeptidase YkuD (ErfK/YbiS/YcfS/YnhG family)